MSLATHIVQILAIDPAAPALEFSGDWYSWGEIARAVTVIDEMLAKSGFGPDTRVGVLLRNDVAIVPAVLALLVSERCLVTLNPILPSQKLVADVRDTQISVLVGLSDDLDAIVDVWRDGRCLVIELTGDRSASARIRQEYDAGQGLRIDASGVAVEMLTSGTTGPPKRVALPRANFERSVFGAAHFEKGRASNNGPALRSGVQLLMAPFAHIGGLLALLNAVVAGRSATLLPKFSVPGFRDAIKRHGIKVASAPPAALKMILDDDVPKDELASLRAFRTGTAPLDPNLAEAFYERYQIPVLQNYGATEFGGVAGWTLADFDTFRIAKRGAVGRFNPGISGRVVDAQTGEPVEAGDPGILELKAPQIGDGVAWLRTTDLAKLDCDGFLYILGRADNVIIRGGFKIHPDDVVRAAESHRSIREAVVVAMPDGRLGQVPVLAFLTKTGEQVPSGEELDQFLRGQLLPYQLPVAFHAMQDFPRTSAMKIDQAAIRLVFEELKATGPAN